MPDAETLSGTVERVVFTNPENGFTVLRVRVPGQTGVSTVVGQFPPISAGESAEFHGEWGSDPRFGRQFRAREVALSLPSTEKGLIRYLASGVCSGVGEETARRIVERFGEATIEVLDTRPDRLLEVEGIGPVRAKRIREGWNRERGVRDVMLFLQGQEISSRLAMKIWKAYGRSAVARLREDPYAVAEEIDGIGWKTADRIARSLGLPHDAPSRIEAGVQFFLRESAARGHTCVARDAFEARAAEALDVDPAAVESGVARLAAAGGLRAREDAERGALLFLPALDRAEEDVAADLVAIAGTAGPAPLEGPAWLLRAEDDAGVELGERQRAALASILTERLVIVTGGPGTGKTTLVRSVIRLLERWGKAVELAAPTGRAAKRLAEATSRPARTLHRLLEWDPRANTFGRTRARPLEASAVIVDEASMIDLLLMQALTAAIPPGALLLLVGDADQLPPVGPGNVLRDAIAAEAGRVIHLDRIYRQSERSAIVVNAHRVNHGEMPILPEKGAPVRPLPAQEFHFLETASAEATVALLKELVAGPLVNEFGLEPFRDLQVLSPMYRGTVGVENVNVELQGLLNAAGRPIGTGSSAFRIGDKVMQIRNDYQKEVWNGDIGRVAEADDEERSLLVDFDGRLVPYDLDDLDQLVLAYAVSVHKSQGSEYRAVILPLHSEHYVMLRRNLLYTAITRGKEWVFLLGDRRALGMAVRNFREEERVTLLSERIRAAAGRSGVL